MIIKCWGRRSRTHLEKGRDLRFEREQVRGCEYIALPKKCRERKVKNWSKKTKAKRSLKFEYDLMVGGHMWCRFKGKKEKRKRNRKEE